MKLPVFINKQNTVVFFSMLGIALIALSSETALSAAAVGVELSLFHILPSTFPFLVLAELLGKATAGKKGCLLTAVAVSNLSGYPVGGRISAEISGKGGFESRERILLLACCIGAGPGFLIGAVGSEMLGSEGAGILLFVSQLLSTFTVFGILTFMRLIQKKPSTDNAVASATLEFSFAQAFVESVKHACLSMLYISGFVILFSCCIGGLEGYVGSLSGMFGMLFAGILEISNGCARSNLLYGSMGFASLGGLLGFGGLSVFFQLCVITRDSGITAMELFISRLISSLLNALYSLLLYLSFPSVIPTALFDTQLNKTALHPLSLTVSLCLLFGVLLCVDKTNELRLFAKKEA